MKNGGITYVNEWDGNDSTVQGNDRKCDACTVTRRKYMDRHECWFGELKSKTKRGWNIIGDERPTPTGMDPI
jgi:hypothetical protein